MLSAYSLLAYYQGVKKTFQYG